jgi:hypothetical protein
VRVVILYRRSAPHDDRQLASVCDCSVQQVPVGLAQSVARRVIRGIALGSVRARPSDRKTGCSFVGRSLG